MGCIEVTREPLYRRTVEGVSAFIGRDFFYLVTATAETQDVNFRGESHTAPLLNAASTTIFGKRQSK